MRKKNVVQPWLASDKLREIGSEEANTTVAAKQQQRRQEQQQQRQE
jgi:hypothetical protein